MEDPWANAWGDSNANALPTQSTSAQTPSISSSTWSAPSVSAIHGDNEDDLSTHSWTVDPVWDSSTGNKSSLWGSGAPVESWNSINSTYGGISFRKSTEEALESSLITPVETPSGTPEHDSPISQHTTLPPIDPPPEIPSPSPPPFRAPTPPPLPPNEVKDDADGFGTFESGDDEVEQDDQWTTGPAYVLPSAELNAWGDTTSSTSPEPKPTSDPKASSKALDDAWARAIEAREKQDRHVVSTFSLITRNSSY